MEKESLKYQRLREEMVRQQIEARGVSEPAVLAAMRRVPRHMFVTEALALTAEDRVLEIGTGSGYQAAVLAQLAYRVFTIERIRPLYLQARRLFDELRLFNIVTRYGDGSKGWEEESPFDAIILTAGAPMVPAVLMN